MMEIVYICTSSLSSGVSFSEAYTFVFSATPGHELSCIRRSSAPYLIFAAGFVYRTARPLLIQTEQVVHQPQRGISDPVI